MTNQNNNTLLDQIKASPLIWFAVMFLLGDLAGSYYKFNFLIWLILSLAVFAFAIIVRLIKPTVMIALLLIPGFFFLGGARYQVAQQVLPADHISFFNDSKQHVYITGTVKENPDVRDKVVNLKIDVDSIDNGTGDLPTTGTVLVKLYNEYDVKYGDRVRARGLLETPPESADFSYREYLLRQGVHSILSTSNITLLRNSTTVDFQSIISSIRNKTVGRIDELFQPPVASLMAGILIGRDQNIPEKVQQAFIDTGTSHIIAISGFNIGIIAFIFMLVFNRLFGRKYGTILSIVAILLYTVLAGAEPPLVRASIMGILGAIGILLGRRNATLTALFFAAMIMALINPMVLWEVGFQLSFAATIGIVTFTEPLQELARKGLATFVPENILERFVMIVSDVLIITLSAQITVLPIILYHFGKLPLITFVTNPLILPLQPLLMILGGLSVITSFLFYPLGQLLAVATHPLGAATIGIVEFTAKYSGWNINFGNFTILLILAYFALLLAILFFWNSMNKGLKPSILVPILLLILFLSWDSVSKLPDGKLHITIMDVGSADALFIEAPNGQTILINGGDDPSALLDQVGRRTSIFEKKIDLLILASTQENQVAALPKFIGLFPAKQVIWAGNQEASFSSLKLHDSLLKKKSDITYAMDGLAVDLGDGARIRFLSTSSRGAILLVEKGSFSVLLPIGVNRDNFEEVAYGKKFKPVTGYYFAESGYAPSNPITLINSLSPEMFLLSVSGMDSRGYPSRTLMDEINNPNIFRTDQSGWIEIITDGVNYSISTER